MLKKLFVYVSLLGMLIVGTAQAEDKKAQVTEILQNAVEHYNTVGAEQAFKDFEVKEGDFFQGEIYVIVMNLDDEKLVFHPVIPKLVGKSIVKLKDTDGKTFVREMLDVAKSEGSGWVSYKWPHPQTKKIAQKHAYLLTSKNRVFITGYYE